MVTRGPHGLTLAHEHEHTHTHTHRRGPGHSRDVLSGSRAVSCRQPHGAACVAMKALEPN
eukprot:1069938-Prymnesium_polylepis.1